MHVFLATDLIDDPAEHDADEVITLQRLPLVEAVGLIETGGVKDGKSMVGLLLAKERVAVDRQR
jgi:hypothetical protein